MEENALKLIDACCSALEKPEFAPRNSTTYCNQAVQYIATMMGCIEFSASMNANRMIDMMAQSEHFAEIPVENAQAYANNGSLVIAGLKAMPHGHVCVIRPGKEIYSGKWMIKAPRIINVGGENFISRSLSWAFKDIPKVYLWRES